METKMDLGGKSYNWTSVWSPEGCSGTAVWVYLGSEGDRLAQCGTHISVK